MAWIPSHPRVVEKICWDTQNDFVGDAFEMQLFHEHGGIIRQVICRGFDQMGQIILTDGVETWNLPAWKERKGELMLKRLVPYDSFPDSKREV